MNQIYPIVALSFALSLAVAVSSAQEFVGVDQCKICHNKAAEGAQFQQWTETKHAQAFEVLKTDEAKAVAERVGLTVPAHEAADCLKCHVTGYNAETKAPPAKITMTMGVQCESCHGPGSEHVAQAKKFQLSRDKDAAMKPTNVRPNQDLCVTCHNPENPTWDPERYTLADGTKVGFDFEQAYAQIDHQNPQKADDAANE